MALKLTMPWFMSTRWSAYAIEVCIASWETALTRALCTIRPILGNINSDWPAQNYLHGHVAPIRSYSMQEL